VFAAAFAAAGRYEPTGATAAAWLFTIAQNTMVSSVRKGRVEEAARRALGVRDAVALREDSRVRLEQAVVGDAWVADLLSRLRDDQREAVRERVLEDRSYDEIAAALDTSSLVVRKRVSRGLASLRREVTERS
jgi:RNA polymerase sigma-70 factor (ECF subfamily)